MAALATYSTSALISGTLTRVPAAAMSPAEVRKRCAGRSARNTAFGRPRRYESSSALKRGCLSSALAYVDSIAGALEISGSRSTLSCGVKGSGRSMWRGNAERITLRSWMHEDGITSQKEEWYSQRNSGKSWSRISSTRSSPLYSSLIGSVSWAMRRCGSRYRKKPTSMRWNGPHPFPRVCSRRGIRFRCEAISSHENENPGTSRGCTAWRKSASESTSASPTESWRSRRCRMRRWKGFWLNVVRSPRSHWCVCITFAIDARTLLTRPSLLMVVERLHSSK
mmetsp:Transcript_8075/g.19706  ORF Transcript_8075/g.19706 Transcript_8075/m.19706 type:complete len:281 (-) Transcript_8075:312-1154(-)